MGREGRSVGALQIMWNMSLHILADTPCALTCRRDVKAYLSICLAICSSIYRPFEQNGTRARASVQSRTEARMHGGFHGPYEFDTEDHSRWSTFCSLCMFRRSSADFVWSFDFLYWRGKDSENVKASV